MKSIRYLTVLSLIRIEKGGYSNLVVDEVIKTNSLSSPETASLTHLVYLILERQITLDYIISRYLKMTVSSLDIEVLIILRVGLGEILFAKSVPTYAAVNESVELTNQFKKTSAAGLVNAVLRKAATFNLDSLLEIPDEIMRLSLIYSINIPLVKMLLSQYGEGCKEILSGMFTKRRIALRVNSLKTSVEYIINTLKQHEVTVEKSLIPWCVFANKYSSILPKLSQQGLIRIQSYASQAAIYALNPHQASLVLDLCAAPGGKTLTAAQMMQNEGTVYAFDRHENRLKLIETAAKTEGVLTIKSLVSDSTEFISEYENSADFVIADVPCSGYGEIHSKPELRMKEPPSDDTLYKTQCLILKNGCRYLKPKGRLLYSTCTINIKENEDILLRFLNENRNYCLDTDIELNEFINNNGYMKKLPSKQDGEGFFFAVIERRNV